MKFDGMKWSAKWPLYCAAAFFGGMFGSYVETLYHPVGKLMALVGL